MVKYLEARGMWDEPAFGLSDNERGYVESVPKLEAERMLRQVGFWAGMTGEISLDSDDVQLPAFGTLSDTSADGERVGTGALVARGYIDGHKVREALTEYGIEGGLN